MYFDNIFNRLTMNSVKRNGMSMSRVMRGSVNSRHRKILFQVDPNPIIIILIIKSSTGVRNGRELNPNTIMIKF